MRDLRRAGPRPGRLPARNGWFAEDPAFVEGLGNGEALALKDYRGSRIIHDPFLLAGCGRAGVHGD